MKLSKKKGIDYDENHMSKTKFSTGIKCIPLVPDISEMRERAKRAGRNYIPHVLFLKGGIGWLDIRIPEEIFLKRHDIMGFQAAKCAEEWLTMFEKGLSSKEIWNYEFCGMSRRDGWIE